MKNLLKVLYLRLVSFLILPFRVFKIHNNKIYVINFTNKGFSDSPKYIIDELLNKNPNFEVIWKGKNLSFPYRQIKSVKAHSLKDFWHLSTSKIIISNVRLPLYYNKRKKQFYIEIWHGGIAFKKVGLDGNNQTSFSRAMLKHLNRNVDIMISDSEFTDKLYRNAFNYKGDILRLGLPRTQGLFRNYEDIVQLKNKLNIHDEIVLTYAPTFRDNGDDNYDLDYHSIKCSIEKRFEKKVKILLRLHPLVNYNSIDENCLLVDDSIMDLYETLAVTDILISDFSSLIFEYMLLKRPIFLYAKDYEQYKKIRGLYFEPKDLPFSFSYTNEELLKKIEKFDESEYLGRINAFIEEMGVVNPKNSSKEIVKIIEKFN